jgi:hypothetical protein
VLDVEEEARARGRNERMCRTRNRSRSSGKLTQDALNTKLGSNKLLLDKRTAQGYTRS